MKISKGEIEGLLVIQPNIFNDERGYFFESFNQQIWDGYVDTPPVFVQDNESLSHKNVLRGLHFQAPPFEQGKLVRVAQGAVLDVAVDIRKNSPTYGQHQIILLSEENKTQFYIPPGFAHGFLSLADHTRFLYKCTNYYNRESEGGVRWNDTVLSIDWQIDLPIVSEKDQLLKDFSIFDSPFN